MWNNPWLLILIYPFWSIMVSSTDQIYLFKNCLHRIGMSHIESLDKQRKTLRYINIQFMFLFFVGDVYEVRIQSKRVRTYRASVAGTLCVYESNSRRTHMACLLEWPADLSLRLRDQGTSLRLSDQRISPFTRETSGPLPFAGKNSGSLSSVQNYRPYIVFSSPM